MRERYCKRLQAGEKVIDAKKYVREPVHKKQMEVGATLFHGDRKVKVLLKNGRPVIVSANEIRYRYHLTGR